jgi:hypothetical protein
VRLGIEAPREVTIRRGELVSGCRGELVSGVESPDQSLCGDGLTTVASGSRLSDADLAFAI